MTKKKTSKKKRARSKSGESISDVAKRVVQKNHWPWELRHYQIDVTDAFDAGIRRFLEIWHRRAGKDITGISISQREMRRRIGSYVHFFPAHVQAKRAIWNGIDPRRGARIVDIGFHDIESDRNNTDMMIEAYNGSTWQLLGSDNYDRIVGANIVGAVFSEWALCDPRAWDYIRPMLLENNGWAMFITTYRGRNHAWQMMQKVKDNPNWHTSVLTVEDTHDADGNRIITDADIQEERDSGMSEAMIQQEYYCNPEATADGAIYGRETEQLRKDTSRQVAIYNPNHPVYCVWNIDLPIHASYVLAQPGYQPTILEAQTLEMTSLSEAMAKAEQHRFPVQSHVLHDSQREYIAQFHDLDRSPLVLSNTNSVLEQTSTSSLLQRCMITKERCDVLLDSLGGYVRRERFDAQVADMQWSDAPVNSWHARLVNALETWAAYEYHNGAGDGWHGRIDYSAMDRAAKTLL